MTFSESIQTLPLKSGQHTTAHDLEEANLLTPQDHTLFIQSANAHTQAKDAKQAKTEAHQHRVCSGGIGDTEVAEQLEAQNVEVTRIRTVLTDTEKALSCYHSKTLLPWNKTNIQEHIARLVSQVESLETDLQQAQKQVEAYQYLERSPSLRWKRYDSAYRQSLEHAEESEANAKLLLTCCQNLIRIRNAQLKALEEGKEAQTNAIAEKRILIQRELEQQANTALPSLQAKETTRRKQEIDDLKNTLLKEKEQAIQDMQTERQEILTQWGELNQKASAEHIQRIQILMSKL